MSGNLTALRDVNTGKFSFGLESWEWKRISTYLEVVQKGLGEHVTIRVDVDGNKAILTASNGHGTEITHKIEIRKQT